MKPTHFARFALAVGFLLAVSRLAAAPAQEPLSWPNLAPYVRVGGAVESVLVPVGAVQAAQRRLSKPPDQWSGGMARDKATGRRIAQLYVGGGAGGDVSFLVTRRSWSLFTDRNVAALNEVMERPGRALAGGGLDDPQRLGEYLCILDGLVCGMNRTLDNEFVRLYYTGAWSQKHWLGAREKRAGALGRLCHDPVVTWQAGGEVTIIYNTVLFDGSAVRRTVHARVVGHRLELLRLKTVVLRSAGTFSYPAFG